MITRPKGAPKVHEFLTYDLEWRKEGFDSQGRAKLSLILAGIFCPKRGYSYYTRIEDFLNACLSYENEGKRMYAHFGGASDMVFLLPHLQKRKSLEISCIFSGSSAIVVSCRDKRGMTWVFVDSFWTIRTPLRDIGKKLGPNFLKGEMDFSREYSLKEWAEYNEQDCLILHAGLEIFQKTLNSKGGEMRITGAGSALDLFLRSYLLSPIQNSAKTDEYVLPAYRASRVEPLAAKMDAGNVWDINSSFPYSFTFPNPGKVISASNKIPTEGLWCADVEVNVHEQFLPPIPFKTEKSGRTFFPTGKWRARITSEEALCGGFDITKVHSCWVFEPRMDLAQFAHDLFALRKVSSGFDSQCWKIIVNSLYGKFAEQPEKEVLLINPHKSPPLGAVPLAKNIYSHTKTVKIAHSHVPFSAFVTARSRRILREYANDAFDRTGRVAYLDTDSIMTPAEFESSGELGKLKLEAKIIRGEFHAAKVYAYEKESGWSVKAKGFARVVSEAGKETRLKYEDFVKIKGGHDLQVERMRRIRELVKAHGGFDFEPDVIRMEKGLRNPKPKRKISEDGYTSSPWDVKELDE